MSGKQTQVLAEIFRIGDEIVNSIGENRLKNDAVLRGKVDAYHRKRSCLTDMENIDIEKIQKISDTIREIEQRLDIVAPN